MKIVSIAEHFIGKTLTARRRNACEAEQDITGWNVEQKLRRSWPLSREGIFPHRRANFSILNWLNDMCHRLKSSQPIIKTILLCGGICLGVSHAQQPLSKRATEVKEKVAKFKLNQHISVIPIQGHEEFGSFLSSTTDGFTFHDIDQKIDVTFKFEEVKKVKNGYGGYNHIHHRHVDKDRNRIVAAIFAGVLIGLVVALVVSM